MNAEFLLTKHPLLKTKNKSVSSYLYNYFENATHLNIATGFISNESIVTLRSLVEYRKNQLSVNLFIGMNYIDGFTRLQYEAVKDLANYLKQNNIGDVYVSPKALYHGKLYSFLRHNECLGSFMGSSNLSSFMGTTSDMIEVDAYFHAKDGENINNAIVHITNKLGESITQAQPIETFKEPLDSLLDNCEHVKKLSTEELVQCLKLESSPIIRIPLKAHPKSNLNTYFGKGKNAGRFSRRNYYEVEFIIPKKTDNIELLPGKSDGNFTVITYDGYKFECSRQGDYSKNFRSAHDLSILGKWIKEKMENCGALKIGEIVTDESLKKFGKSHITLTPSIDKSFWIINLE